MKKVPLILILCLSTVITTYGQRYTDLKIVQLSPKQGDTITANEPFSIAAKIYNNGPDTILAIDTLQLGLIFNDDTISFYIDTINTVPYLPLDGYYIEPNDSISIGFGFTIGDGWDTGFVDFCLSIMPSNTADIVVDTATTDNKDCSAILSVADPTSVSGKLQSPVPSISVYPNPAMELVNFDFVLTQAGMVETELYDMTGKLVVSSVITGKTGKNTLTLNTVDVLPGLYLYRLKVQDNYYKGRLQITH